MDRLDPIEFHELVDSAGIRIVHLNHIRLQVFGDDDIHSRVCLVIDLRRVGVFLSGDAILYGIDASFGNPTYRSLDVFALLLRPSCELRDFRSKLQKDPFKKSLVRRGNLSDDDIHDLPRHINDLLQGLSFQVLPILPVGLDECEQVILGNIPLHGYRSAHLAVDLNGHIDDRLLEADLRIHSRHP